MSYVAKLESENTVTATRALELFGVFVSRHHAALFNNATLREEFKRIDVECDGVKDHYLSVSRVGSTVALNRTLRRSIFDLYEKAIEHASFERWARR